MLFDYVVLKGTPFEMGEQFGEQRKNQIRNILDQIFEGKSAAERDDMLRRALSYEKIYEEFNADMLEEQKGMARASGITLAEALLCETKWDLDRAPVGECTSFAVSSPITKNGEFFAGINKDVSEVSRENLLIVRMEPKNGIRKIIAAYNGSLAGPAMNEYGVCFFGNSLYGGRLVKGIPQPLWQRRILEHKTVEEVVNDRFRLRSAGYPGGPGNDTVADGQGNAACIESLDGMCEVTWLADSPYGFLSHANNLICLNKAMHRAEEPWRSGNSKGRQGRLEELFIENKGKVDLETIQKILSDHVGLPCSICRHNANPLDNTTALTAASFIAEPKNRRCRICKGNPCENPYVEYVL